MKVILQIKYQKKQQVYYINIFGRIEIIQVHILWSKPNEQRCSKVVYELEHCGVVTEGPPVSIQNIYNIVHLHVLLLVVDRGCPVLKHCC